MKNESERLKQLYEQMGDGELEHLAGEIDTLSEVARPLLLAEFSRRGLEIASDEGEPLLETVAEFNEEWVPVTQVRTLDDLSDLRDLLDEAQIPSSLGASKIPGWIGIAVKGDDETRARLVIERAAMENVGGIEAVGEFETACPNCGSADVVLWERETTTGAEPNLAAETEARYHWICEACDHDWEDEMFKAQ